MKNIIIIGSRGYKSEYGGWETFVTNLIDNYNDSDTKFYIPELSHEKTDKVHMEGNVECVPITVKPMGSITMMNFAFKAVMYYKKRIKKEHMQNVVMYILGCRVGPLFSLIHKCLNKMGVVIMINPDGLEWKREKWNFLIKQYFKLSERTMIKSANYVICDSSAILNYVKEKYQKYDVNARFIAYGAYLKSDKELLPKTQKYMEKFDIRKKDYYLFVGRFVPENNIELIIKEFMKTNIQSDLVIISNVEENSFYEKLVQDTHFLEDKRIKFVGSLYDDEVLRQIRKNAIAYIHGHSAGGTNPSLLEALSITNVNILYDVVYNREVGSNAVLYFNKNEDNLKNILEQVSNFRDKDIENYGKFAKERIQNAYTWDIVVSKYKKLFEEILK
ncbi:MAG: DUF1972 domain-containing protein [Bacilli bacterium]|nr:DUF1972 domain-containing protein [Bacilli bacterium]